MSHSNLTRWIEAAEARKFYQTALAERNWQPNETQSLRLGEAIVKIGQAFALFFHPLSVARH